MSRRPRGLTASDRLLHTRPQPDTVLLMSPAAWNCIHLLGKVVALSADLYGPRRTSLLWDSLRGLATMPALWALLPCLAQPGSASLLGAFLSLLFHEGGSSQSLGCPLE